MSYPRVIRERTMNHPAIMELDPDTDNSTDVELQAAYSTTVDAHSVIEVELDSGRGFLVHVEDTESLLAAVSIPTDADGIPTVRLGAEVGSWCIKTLDGKANYGMLAAEDPSGRHTIRLYQSQLDRLKALASRVFRDKTTGAVLDATRTAAIA